jgi:hypothetical protein
MALCIVFACSAGSPGFDSRLRHISLGCPMQSMEVALVKLLQSIGTQVIYRYVAKKNTADVFSTIFFNRRGAEIK